MNYTYKNVDIIENLYTLYGMGTHTPNLAMREAMKVRGLTGRQLAARAGLSPCVVSGVLNGHRKIRPLTAAVIAYHLGLRVEQLQRCMDA